MFYRGFPSYSGLIWFSYALGGAIFLKLKGNIMPDPPGDIFSTCGECIINLYGEIRVTVTFMSVDGNLDFVLIFYFSVAQACMLLAILSSLQRTSLIFNFALPFWEHYVLSCYHSCTTICLHNSSMRVPLSTSIFVPLCIG